MEAYLNFVSRFAKSILLLLVLISAYFVYMTGYLTEDSNPYLLPESHPARSQLLDIRQDFTGTYDSILLALYNQDSIFNKTSLKAIFKLTQSVRQISLVDEADIAKLTQLQLSYPDNHKLNQTLTAVLAGGLSQNDAKAIRVLAEQADAWTMASADKTFLKVVAERLDPIRELAGMAASENVFLEKDGSLRVGITLDSENPDVEKVRKAIVDNELTTMGIIDKEQKIGLLVIEISILPDDAEGQLRAYNSVTALIDEYKQQNPELQDDVYIAGVPVFFAEQKKIMDRDLGVLLPAVLALVALILALFFRKSLGVVIPLVNVIMCTIWTMGAMAVVGIPIDLITSALPVFLVTICSSDAVHVMADYYKQREQGKTNQQAIKSTMRVMTSPVILTTITTCLTFLVSTTSSIENLRNFGIAMSFGMFVAMIISLLLIPAWLSLLSQKTPALNKIKQDDSYLLSRLLVKVFKPVMQKRKTYFAAFVVVLAGLATLASQVRIDDMGSGYFAKNNEFRVADDFINEHIAGTSPGWIEIDTHQHDGVLTLETVNFIDQLETFIHQQNNITFSYSIARYIRRINYVLNDLNPDYNRLPKELEVFTDTDEETGEIFTTKVQGSDIIRQSVLMYENGGGSDLTNVLSEDFSKTTLLYTMNTTVASDFQAYIDVLEPWLKANLPEGMSYKIAGSPIVWTAVLDELLAGQLLSVLLAFATVMIVMGIWLKSMSMGLIGTLPLAVTVVFYYAAMTVFDIELNIGTAIISFLVLGVVDYSVHYLLRTKQEMEGGLSRDEALIAALNHSGRSIVANVMIFSIGFVALLFSEFKPIIDLGLLVGISLLLSGFMSLFIITLLAPWLIPEPLKVNETDTLVCQ